MPASIFKGTKVKTLKDTLTVNDNVDVISGDSDNPTSVAKDGAISSLFLKSDEGRAWIKQDAGTTTNWNELATVGTALRTESTAYSAVNTDDVILADANSAAFTITLFAASGNQGKIIEIKKIDSTLNAVTIDGSGTDTIDGELTTTLNTENETLKIICDGTNWRILKRDYPQYWQAYTVSITASGTNPTKATTTTQDQGFWKRVSDDSIMVRYYYEHTDNTGAAAGTGDYRYSLPTGITIDATKGATSFGLAQYGSATAFVPTLGATGIVGPATTTDLYLYLVNNSFGPTNVSATFYAINASTVQYSFTATIPVSGWPK